MKKVTVNISETLAVAIAGASGDKTMADFAVDAAMGRCDRTVGPEADATNGGATHTAKLSRFLSEAIKQHCQHRNISKNEFFARAASRYLELDRPDRGDLAGDFKIVLVFTPGQEKFLARAKKKAQIPLEEFIRRALADAVKSKFATTVARDCAN